MLTMMMMVVMVVMVGPLMSMFDGHGVIASMRAQDRLWLQKVMLARRLLFSEPRNDKLLFSRGSTLSRYRGRQQTLPPLIAMPPSQAKA
jgi:hypothetical protein